MSAAQQCDSLIGGIYQRRATIRALALAQRGEYAVRVTNASLRPARRGVGSSRATRLVAEGKKK